MGQEPKIQNNAKLIKPNLMSHQNISIDIAAMNTRNHEEGFQFSIPLHTIYMMFVAAHCIILGLQVLKVGAAREYTF